MDRMGSLALEGHAARVRHRTEVGNVGGSDVRLVVDEESESVVMVMGRLLTSERHEGWSCVPKEVQYALKEATTKSNVMGCIAVRRSNWIASTEGWRRGQWFKHQRRRSMLELVETGERITEVRD